MIRHPIRVSAPGKLFLVGEYAVLEGAPALLTAVDRRAFVTLTPAEGGRWTLYSPGIGREFFELAEDGSIPTSSSSQTRQDLSVFDACRSECAAKFGPPDIAFDITIDTRAFTVDGYKLGLGSSAAVAAALCHALAVASGVSLSPDELTRLAIDSHRRAQNGYGSGGDVAACVHGGLIFYRTGSRTCQLHWPDTLKSLVVATGSGASTTTLVGRVRTYAETHPEDYQRLMKPLVNLAETAVRSAQSADAFIELCHNYFGALQALDEQIQAGIVTDRHRKLARVTANNGAVFKSCGAGGGDVGLIFGDARQLPTSLAQTLESLGGNIVPLAMNAPGVRID